MLSMAAQPNMNMNMNMNAIAKQHSPFKICHTFPFKPPTFATSSFPRLSNKFPNFSFQVSSTEVVPVVDDDHVPSIDLIKEKLKVVVKATDKPRIVLKFIWMEKNIGLALDQTIPGHGTIPLSPYYFWPRKDAWEELKLLLESKPWISQKQMIILLNQATDIINLWQQSGGNLAS